MGEPSTMVHEPEAAEPDGFERLRAGWYGLLARLLAAPPDTELLNSLRALAGDGSDLGRAAGALAEAARDARPERLEREYHHLFIGVGEGEVIPYGSYYLTGFMHERPLARLRGDLAKLGIARADGVAEPEDGMASLCEIMSGLISGAFGTGTTLAGQRAFFDRHLEPWAVRFFQDLEEAPSADFYRSAARLGRAFMELERAAFDIAA